MIMYINLRNDQYIVMSIFFILNGRKVNILQRGVIRMKQNFLWHIIIANAINPVVGYDDQKNLIIYIQSVKCQCCIKFGLRCGTISQGEGVYLCDILRGKW